MELILLIGIQATGKSSFYKEFFSETHLNVSLDMLKSRSRERALLETCFNAGIPVVVDNTNATSRERKRYVRMAAEVGYGVKGVFFESTLMEALARNSARTLMVPALVIRHTWDKLQVPVMDEGFDELRTVILTKDGFAAIPDISDCCKDAPTLRKCG